METKKSKFNSSSGGGGSKSGDKEEGRRGHKEKSLTKKRNPLGPKRKPWTCHYCGSEYHFIVNHEKRKKEAKIVEDESEGKAEDRFSWIAVLLEVKKNPEEAGMDEAVIFGKKLTLEKLSVRYYVLPRRPNYQKVESDVCLRTYGINFKLEKERLCTLKNLHEQMVHPAQVKLEALIKNGSHEERVRNNLKSM